MATQILVIFLIRTAHAVWTSRPHKVLAFTSLGALAVALLLALTSLGTPFGFVPLPPSVIAAMGVLVVGYLACAELAKHAAMAHRRRRTGLHHR